MPDQKSLVINTGPIIALIAATGDLNLLDKLYDRIFVPLAVKNELYYKGDEFFGVKEFKKAISNMQKRGIFLSDELIEKAIKMANE